MDQKPVLFSEQSFGSTTLGVVELNSPKSLNALSLEIIDLIIGRLESWKDNDRIQGILIKSSFEKAFCAGGDIKALAMKIRSGANPDELSAYFEKEYYLDAYLNNYPKATIGLAEGYVLGGGWGFLNGCDIKLASETAKFGMPEIAIGFFPDVGAVFFLQKLPLGLRKYICLTKTNLDAADALHFEFVDGVFSSAQRRQLEAGLLKLPWESSKKSNLKVLKKWIKSWRADVERTSELSKNEKKLSKLFENKNLNEILKAHPIQGSPVTAQVIHELFHAKPKKTLESQLVWDWSIAFNMLKNPEFTEGVRAVLIDKDQAPNWTYKMGQVPLDVIADILKPNSANPLEDRIHSTFNN